MRMNNGDKNVSYTEAQATKWLVWLARGMQRHGQTVFQIEQLQPSWLQGCGELLVYLISTRTIWGLVSGSIFGLYAGLIFELFFSLTEGLITGLLVGLIYGLIAGLIDFWRYRRPPPIIIKRRSHRTLKVILGTVSWGLFGGLMLGLVYRLIIELMPVLRHGGGIALADKLIFELTYGLIFGLAYGSIFGRFWMGRSVWRTLSQSIQPVEMLQWSWRSSLGAGLRGLILGLIYGLITGLMYGLIVGYFVGLFLGQFFGLFMSLSGNPAGQDGGLVGGFAGGLGGGQIGTAIGGVFGAVLGGLVGGLAGGFIPKIRDLKTVPNQGIRLSFRYAVQMLPVGGAIVGLLLVGLFAKDIGVGLAYGLIAGIGFGMWFGGLEVVDHIILRVIMAAKGHAPLNFARFLVYAAEELHFLQKVGGGYMFVHRYLLEYFAGLEGTVEPNSSSQQTQLLSSE